MRHQILNLKKKLLLVELPEGNYKDLKVKSDLPYEDNSHLFYFSDGSRRIADLCKAKDIPFNLKLIGKLTDITEEQFGEWVRRSRIGNYIDYTHVDKKLDKIGLLNALLAYPFKTAKESFFSKLKEDWILFNSEKPCSNDSKYWKGRTYEDQGFYKSELFEIDLKEWQKANKNTWNMNRCYLFETI